jgi:hypothetical protein
MGTCTVQQQLNKAGPTGSMRTPTDRENFDVFDSAESGFGAVVVTHTVTLETERKKNSRD